MTSKKNSDSDQNYPDRINEPQGQVDKLEAEKAANQNIVMEGDDAQEVVDEVHRSLYGPEASTVMKIGDRDSGPRTYAEAVDAGTGNDPQHVVVNPSTYEAAVDAVNEGDHSDRKSKKS